MIYETLYCLWLLSYNKNISEQFQKTNVIARIVEILKTVQKEKIIRVSMATLVVSKIFLIFHSILLNFTYSFL
jgi:hypothetical protein